MKKGLGALALFAYVSTVIAANWAVKRYGSVSVGFGYEAPAAVYFIGLALVLRDYVQWSLGRLAALFGLAAGALLSYLVADAAVATASAAAFAFSELVDFVLFTWLAPRWARAVFVGGASGAVVDSVLFLSIAFGSLHFLPGQLLGKLYGVLLATAIIGLTRPLRGRQAAFSA
jgi:uncharacterized PurR-regulated membrane protein YhhQ (DUF165 family)